MERPIFLDYNSTTPLDPEVQAAMQDRQAEAWGNPSSVHAVGRAAKKLLEEARERTAAEIGCDPGELYFTSGGTEADNLALKGIYHGYPDRARRLAVSAIEHPAVGAAADDLKQLGAEVVTIPCDSRGVVAPAALTEALGAEAVLVSVMAANNETGTIQPVADLAAAAHDRGALFHTDAVQALGKIEANVQTWGVDLLSLAAHKFYGPRGIGALFVRRGLALSPQITGGSHERRRRAGTENVIGAWGLACALEKANRLRRDEETRLRRLTEDFVTRLKGSVPDIHLHGDFDLRLPNTVSLSFAGVEGEAVVVSLDLKSICIASGSACSSGATEPSHVILALGCDPQLAAGAVRISFGRFTTEAEADRLLAELPPAVARLRALSPSYTGASAS
jgi:cysteine desulfurase